MQTLVIQYSWVEGYFLGLLTLHYFVEGMVPTEDIKPGDVDNQTTLGFQKYSSFVARVNFTFLSAVRFRRIKSVHFKNVVPKMC